MSSTNGYSMSRSIQSQLGLISFATLSQATQRVARSRTKGADSFQPHHRERPVRDRGEAHPFDQGDRACHRLAHLAVRDAQRLG